MIDSSFWVFLNCIQYGFFMSCKKCLFSIKDIDECSSSPCVHGTCSDRVNGYVCNCMPGYSGNVCNIGR